MVMTSLERLRCAARLEQPDLVPVAPYMGNFGAWAAGVPIDRYCQSGRLMADAQTRAWETFRQDAVVAQSDNYYIAEGFGTHVEHHADGTPTFRAPAVTELAQVFDLKVPDPQRAGRMPVYLEAIGRLSERFKGEVAIRAPGTGPFSLASHVLGTERFLLELALASSEPDGAAARALRRLMELATDALTAFAAACLEAGADMVQAGDSLASNDMISPRMYREWALPYEQRFFAAINPLAQARGAMTLLHICGNMTSVLELMADTGAQILELDSKVSLAEAKQRVGNRVCLMGNLNPVTVLWQGSAAEVESAAAQAIADASHDGGFILGSGCEVPVGAPPENILAMIRAVQSPRVVS